MVDNNDFSVNTHDISSIKEEVLYPNPTSDRFNVKFNLDHAQKVRFEICNLNGQTVALLLDTFVKSGNDEFSFSTQPLASGNYILKISTKDKIILSEKLTVQ
jgi:hypothetical protein